MMKSVLVMGDAGALPYIQNDVPKSAFNFCCSCTLPKNEQETNLNPIKKRTIAKKAHSGTNHLGSLDTNSNYTDSTPSTYVSRPDHSSWKWTNEIIAAYTDTQSMKKFTIDPTNRSS